MLNDPLANTLSKIKNAEKVSKPFILVTPISTLIKNTLKILNEEGYLGKFEIITDQKGGVIKIHLIGRINDLNVIKPRFPVKKNTIEKYEKRFLPAKDFGILIISTPKGLLTHNEAKKKSIGGKLIAYCY